MTKSPFERLLNEATCEDTHVTPLHLFKQISIACYEFEFYNMTRNHIWSNIKDKTPNVRRLNKTLNLIEYLIINSSEELVNEFKEEIYYINMLKEYKTSENYPDIVILVKEKAKFIVDLLENGEKLLKERQEAFKLAERIAGVSSSNKPKTEEKTIENNINENKNVKKMDFQDFSSFGCDKNNNTNNEWIDWTTEKKSNEFTQKNPSNSFEEVQKAASLREKGFSFSVSNPNLKQTEPNSEKGNKGKFEDSFNIPLFQNIQKKEVSSRNNAQILKKAQTMGEKTTQKDLLSFDEPAIPENTQNRTNNLWETNEICPFFT